MQKWFVSSFIALLVVGLVPAGGMLAAPVTPGQGLEISPPVIELNADPGQTVTTQIRVRNVASGELIAKGKADDFGPGNNEDGQPKLLLEEEGATRYSLKRWVRSVPDLRLAPQELKTATISIAVPADAELGGHFGVIRFTAVPPSVEGTGVALSASVGTLVLLRVSGVVTDKVSLAGFSVLQHGKATGFLEHGPVDFVVRLRNEGTVHEKVQGTITVTSALGKKVGTLQVNAKGGNVLPGSVRKFEQQLDKKVLFGHYTAQLDLGYLGGSKKVTGKIGFWVIPWKLILLLLVALVVLMYLLRLAIQRYNAYIIAQARRR